MNVKIRTGCGRSPQYDAKSTKRVSGKNPEKEKQAFRREENRIRKARSSFDPRAEPASCQMCDFYQPSFRYRRCLYSQCPYGKKEEIFRKKPLRGKGGTP